MKVKVWFENVKIKQRNCSKSRLLTKIPKLNGYFKVASPEVETSENPPEAAAGAEPVASETYRTPVELPPASTGWHLAGYVFSSWLTT